MKKLLYLCVLLVTITACKKADLLGLQVQPGEDRLSSGGVDTVSIRMGSVIEDSLRTDNAVSNRNLLGDFKDPIFGRTKATIVSQLVLNANNVQFDTNPVLDSAVLILNYAGFYGDSTTKQTIQVHQLAEALDAKKHYHSFDKLTKGDLLAEKQILPHPNTPIIIKTPKDTSKTDTVAPQVRIRLDSAKAVDLFLKAPSTALASSAEFVKYFKGLVISIDSNATVGTGGMMIFDIYTAGRSKLTLYYHAGAEKFSNDFSMNSTAVAMNQFEHNYTGSEAASALQNPISLTAPLTYVQSMGGIRTTIDFPHIQHLIDSGMISIHKAELVLPLASGTNTTFAEVPRLAIVLADSTKVLQNLPDFALGTSYFNGYYNKTDGAYHFNIALYLQKLLLGERSKNEHLYIVATGAASSAYRTVLNGPGASTPAKLKLSYTKLN